MPTTSRSARNNDLRTLPFHCCHPVRRLRLHGVRHHATQHRPRNDSLWRLLLHAVRGWRGRGFVDDVAVETLKSSFKYRVSGFKLRPSSVIRDRGLLETRNWKRFLPFPYKCVEHAPLLEAQPAIQIDGAVV